MFDYPFAPNTDLRNDEPNRAYIERTLAQPEEPPATDLDEAPDTNVPLFPPTPSGPAGA